MTNEQVPILIMLIIMYFPYPANILCWARGKYLGYEDADLDCLLGILIMGLIPGFSWLVFFQAKNFLVSTEEIEKREVKEQRKKARTEYLAAYLESRNLSIDDMDEWIESLTLIEKLTSKFK